MKILLHFLGFYFWINLLLPGQTTIEYKWIKYYEPLENKALGIWPHDARYSDISKLKELKYRWGFTNVLLQQKRGLNSYNKLIDAGFDSSKVMRHINLANYISNVEDLPEMSSYFIDEPADLNENLSTWNNIKNWIKNKYPNSKIFISGYKRNNLLKDYVNTIADNVMFSSYIHWWEVLGIWISWPENPDQRSDWTDMANLFGNKFSSTWVGAHKDLAEYDALLQRAKNLNLNEVFLFQVRPLETEVDDSNLEHFSDAASKYGYLNTNYHQVKDKYINGDLAYRKFVGPFYSSIPNNFDHSVLLFNNYTVTNNRIEDFFAETSVIAGDPFSYFVPESKSSSFNSNYEIILKPGFKAEYGSEFSASIGD